MVSIDDVLLFLIEKVPGRTEAELAVAIFGPEGRQQDVNRHCLELWRGDKVDRQGHGGRGDEHTYYIPDVRRSRSKGASKRARLLPLAIELERFMPQYYDGPPGDDR